jgi:hypothetical protein
MFDSYRMERGMMMVVHAALIGIVLYAIMVLGLGQSRPVAENRSIVLAACILIYMVVFGHGLPLHVNKLI